MMAELGVRQHNMCSCSVTTLGDILFVNTSNGVDETEENVPAPDAPSFLAMDKHSGKVLWTDHSPGTNILHGQWSSPAAGVLGGQPQVIFAGGDGWLYSFRADRGRDGKPELLWKFDCNPKQSKWRSDGGGTRNSLLATPVIYDGLVYVAVGQDPEAGDGPGRLWCVDPTRRGDVSPELAVRKDDPGKPIPHRRTQAVIPEQNEVAIPNPDSAAVWCYAGRDRNNDGTIDFKEEMHRSMAMASIANDLLFIADFAGLFHCLDAKTGKVHWTHDMFAAVWGSPLIAADHVYVGDEDGDVAVFGLSADPKAAMTRKEGTDELAPISEMQMGSSVYSTPIVANGALFISTSNKLFALQASEAAK
jgi:outer membrane protein assembly factor BamB